MTDHPDLLIDNQSAAPRFSWRVLAIILAAAVTMAGSYALMGARVTELADKVQQFDERGTKGLRSHIDASHDELNELRVQQAETRKDIQFLREMLEYRLTTIEGRLAIRSATRAAAPSQRYDSADAAK